LPHTVSSMGTTFSLSFCIQLIQKNSLINKQSKDDSSMARVSNGVHVDVDELDQLGALQGCVQHGQSVHVDEQDQLGDPQCCVQHGQVVHVGVDEEEKIMGVEMLH
jgi:hypothetical protein